MSYIYVQDPASAAPLADELRLLDSFALDCEAAGFHRYSDRLCLVQLTTPAQTYILDPLGFDLSDILRGPLQDPDVVVLMHGADFDLRLLARDLDIRLRGLFDTQVAAALLGSQQLGLAALLESRLGVKVSKKYQRADWAERPIIEGMLEYAAGDTRYLAALAALLREDLSRTGRAAWVEEECRALEDAAFVSTDAPLEPKDPVLRVKGARDLPPRHVTALREALQWRDEIARRRDRAPFRVVGDTPLIEAVGLMPGSPSELTRIKGFPSALARTEGKALLRRLQAVTALPEEELRPYPRGASRGPGRPPPEIEALAERLKAARNRRAETLGLDRGTLMPNALILAIATARPRDAGQLGEVEGVRQWQVEAVGTELLEALGS